MRIVVLGGSGKIGRAAIRELVAHGHQVLNYDMGRSPDPAARYTHVDSTDFGQVQEALLGTDDGFPVIDAVVHLAAIPGPSLATNAALFRNNLLSTYNVFDAARHAKIRNIVWASSETILGSPFDTPPPYVPVDEEYPVRPESTYALAKCLEEEMARQFCRWDPELKLVGLRFSNVREPQDYEKFPSFDADPWKRRWNLWSYIDVRDAAQAVRLAVEWHATGTHVFVIANSDTVMGRSSAELMATVFPDVPIRHALGEHESLLSSDKARRILGFEPKHGWRDSPGDGSAS